MYLNFNTITPYISLPPKQTNKADHPSGFQVVLDNLTLVDQSRSLRVILNFCFPNTHSNPIGH